MKIKISLRYCQIATAVLNQMSLAHFSKDMTSQIHYTILFELKTKFLEVIRKKENQEESKKVSLEIPDSYALCFFYGYNSILHGFEGVVCKEICKQIEKQLFISGKYKFPVMNQKPVKL